MGVLIRRSAGKVAAWIACIAGNSSNCYVLNTYWLQLCVRTAASNVHCCIVSRFGEDSYGLYEHVYG